MTPIIDTPTLSAACQRLAAADFVTVDTEFIRETTFWPRLCLIQVAGPDETILIDALAAGIDLAPFFDLMRNPGVMKVFHAARQDIEIVVHLGGFVPAPMFDTQVAAMVCGFGDSISYDQLVQKVCGIALDKSDRFTDWARRPLTDSQLAYAAADVTHLRVVYAHLNAMLEKQGRTEWVAEEMAVLTSPSTYRTEPEAAWERLKLRVRKPVELIVLKELAAWREREAQSRDVPRSRILKDDAIYEIAAQQPRDISALGRLRMIPKGFERSRTGEEIVATVLRALEIPRAQWPELPKGRVVPEGSAAAVELLKVLLRLTAERQGVAAKVLATVDDLESIAIDDEADVAALRGWRRDLFGETALRLKHGEIALGFDGKRVTIVEAEVPQVARAGEGARRNRRRRHSSDSTETDAEAPVNGAADGAE
ncbi:ribonuclease D [Segnochrobactraceae bacterium EtOH-i3]